jgi:hypothetical protein
VRPGGLRPATGWAALGAAVLVGAVVLSMPLILGTLRGQGAPVPAVVAAGLLFPLGVCLGVPLPAAARLLAMGGRGGWTALLVATAALAGTLGYYLGYTLGLSWSFVFPASLGVACLFATFMMAGLRALPVASATPASAGPPDAGADTTQYQRPATV